MASVDMKNQAFPIDTYINNLTRYLDTIKYRDTNYDRHKRRDNLHYVYSKAAEHFAQPVVYDTLQTDPKKMDSYLRLLTMMSVYCWAKVSLELQALVAIYFMYTVLLDDSVNNPHSNMAHFFQDLTHGRPQTDPWWRLMIDDLPHLLGHYGAFCQFNIIRSTFDFFQGCWIEEYKFPGFPRSYVFPPFLRRLNGLGHSVGASLFPTKQFDEQTLFTEITTAIAHLEYVVVDVNDLMSFYKEFDDTQDQVTMIRNKSHVEGISLDQTLDAFTSDAIHHCEQIAVLEGKDPSVEATVKAFIQGYTTWHLCVGRYRLKEVYENSGDGPSAAKFRHYYEEARSVGGFDREEWAIPSSDIVGCKFAWHCLAYQPKLVTGNSFNMLPPAAYFIT